MNKYLTIPFSIALLMGFIDTYTFKVMTYNIRRMGQDPAQHQWDNRKNLVFNQVLSQNPAIIGFQEVVKGQQYDDLKKKLGEYSAFGEGRKEKSWNPLQWLVMKHPKAKNECNPIFYKTDLFDLIKIETRDINPGGRFFIGSWLPRIFTAGIFKEKTTNQNFCIINTHLDTDSSVIRNKQVEMILTYVAHNAASMPVVIMGDLNTPIKGEIKKIFEQAGFMFAKDKAKNVEGPQETRTGWNNEQLKIIDHIMVKNMNVEKYSVIENKEGQYPSDHRPVTAEISLQ